MTLNTETGIATAERLGVRLTHPDRAVTPDTTATKAQLVDYYERVAPRMLPHLARRPLSLVRWPHGNAAFFQKHDTGGFPDALKRTPVAEKDGSDDSYFYADDLAGIVAAVQMSTIEFHIWGSHIDMLEIPDRIVFDIDPDEGLDFEKVRAAALEIRDVLGGWGLESFPMVTGGKGIHVIAPLQPVNEWPLVKLFCHTFAQRLEDNAPERFTANIRKAERKGRVFVDYLRNERGSTAVAPFSTRARPGTPCAVPVGWDEVGTLKGANLFSPEAAAERAASPDPWPDYFALSQSVTAGMVEAVAGPLRKTVPEFKSSLAALSAPPSPASPSRRRNR
jgi:bifunctional non-homologous end joining protein LigD